MVLITIFFVIALALGGFAYRLSLGPVQIPWITSRLASAVSGQGIDISISQAALAWAGYKNGGGVPLFLRLGDIVARNSAGVELVEIPSARMVFLPGALLGTSAPILVTSSDALFAGSTVPVSLRAAIRLGFLQFSAADLNFTLGAGALGHGDLREPISGGSFSVNITPDTISLRNGLITLARLDGNATKIGFNGQGNLQAEWQGTLNVTADSLKAADLPAYWPTGLVPQTRSWVVNNITAGNASDAHFSLGLSAPANLTALSLDAASGHFNGDDLSVGWVPGAAPITNVTGVFTLNDRDTINISASAGDLGAIAMHAGHLKITGVSQKDQLAVLSVPVSGTVASVIALLNAAPLNLLKLAPPSLLQATGAVIGTVMANFPLKNDLQLGQVDLKLAAKITDGAAPTPLKGFDFSKSAIDIMATTGGLQAQGSGMLAGQAASFKLTASFGPGQPVINSTLQTTAGNFLLGQIGMKSDEGIGGVSGNVPITAQLHQDASGKATAQVDADLTPAALSLRGFGWEKKAGVAGHVTIGGSIAPDGTGSVSRISAQAPGLNIAGQAAADQPRLLRFSRLDIGTTAAAGTIRAPASPGQAWRVDLGGTALDVSALLKQTDTGTAAPAGTAKPADKPAGAPSSGAVWQADLRFDRLILSPSPAPVLHALVFQGSGQGGSVFNANASAKDDDGQVVSLRLNRAVGVAGQETAHLATPDGGYLLRAMGLFGNLENGTAELNASYSDHSDISGVVTIEQFRLLQAPIIGKILQGMTLYGVADATSGPGLVFDRLVAPFELGPEELTLSGARAFSSSLGFTASGTIRLKDGMADLDTTIIPAYFLNAAPGKIPLIGKLFSAETGGGLFAMRAKISGRLSDPDVAVNPLSALTPGVLRDVFGIGDAKPAS
jgi:hypothetical protein